MANQITHKIEIDTFFHLAIEVAFWDQGFQRKGSEGFEIPHLVSHHDPPRRIWERLEIQPLINSLEFIIGDSQVTCRVSDTLVIELVHDQG